MENKDQMSLGKSKNKFLLLASTLFVLLIVLLVLVVVNNRPKSPAITQTGTDTTGGTAGSGGNRTAPVIATAAPMVTVATWTGLTAPASVPTSASVYTFKTGYTFDEAQMMAQNLGIQGQVQKDNNAVIAYSVPSATDQNASLLAFKLNNGTFVYSSSAGVALPTGSTTEDKAANLLKRLGVYDTTLTSVSTYKDKSQEGVLFVEFHRSWTKVGLPILNPVGLLNVPEDERLAALTLASISSNLPQNSNIYATSDRTDGFVRRDDFNTITVGVNEATQKVVSIKSNMRTLATAAPNTASLLTFDQAVDKLKMGQYEFALTTPSGTGDAMPWDKIYPLNRAEAETANVTDSVIVYLENTTSANQTELRPYYLFRANAMLKSGYRANIIVAVPATAQTSAWFVPFIGANAQVPTADTGQKQGTFDLTASPAVGTGTNTGTNNPPVGVDSSTVPNLADGTPCAPGVAELSPIYNIGGANYGWAPYANWQGEHRTEKGGYWYYIPTENDTALLSNLQNIMDTIQNGVPNQVQQETAPQAAAPQQQTGGNIAQTNPDDQGQKQGTFYVPVVTATSIPARQVQLGDVDIRVMYKVVKDVKTIAEYCPLRVTGSSPTVFVYGQTGANVQVVSGADVSFADPLSNVWNVTVADNGLVVNGLSRNWIYYEYENASFARPAEGWTVEKGSLGSLASKVAAELGLNAQEADRLNFELTHAASGVDADRVFVGVIGRNEVDSKLPLSVSAGYAVERFYFYVGAAGSTTVEAPSLEKVVRSPSMVVELGSYGQK